MFQVDLTNWLEFEFMMIYKLNTGLEGIENLPFWRAQYYMTSFKNFLEEQKAYLDAAANGGTTTKLF